MRLFSNHNTVYRRLFVFGGCLIAAITSVQQIQAQNFFEYNNRHLPQSHTINPAFIPQYKFSLGMGYFSAGMDLAGGNLNSFFNASETQVQTISRLINEDEKQIGLDNQLSTNLFFAGLRLKKSYMSFSSSMNYQGSIRIPKDLFGLMFLGNGAYIDRDANLDFSGTEFMAYNQNQFSYGRFINNKLSIGANVGILNGIAHVGLNQARLGITTDTGTSSIYSIGINGQMQGNASLFGLDFGQLSSDSSYRENLDQIIENNLNNFDLGSNRGYNFGFGFTYRPIEKLRISGSVQNLGYIKWKNGAQNFSMPNFNWTFNGLDTNQIDQIGGNGTNNVTKEITDSLLNKLSINSNSVESYTTNLKPRYVLSAEYFLTPRTQVQWIGGFGFGVKGDKVMNTLSINQELGEWVDIRGSFTLVDDKASRVGLGMSLNLGPVQAFFNINNFLVVSNWDKAKNISGMVGFNLNIGRLKDKDHDMVPDKRDSCRGVYGAISNNGCELGFLGTSMNYPEIDETEEIKPVNEITEEEKNAPRPELEPTQIKGASVIAGTEDFEPVETVDTALFDEKLNDLPLDTAYLDQVLALEQARKDSMANVMSTEKLKSSAKTVASAPATPTKTSSTQSNTKSNAPAPAVAPKAPEVEQTTAPAATPAPATGTANATAQAPAKTPAATPAPTAKKATSTETSAKKKKSVNDEMTDLMKN